MDEINISKTDELTMRLVHYFVTKENYQPILIKGLENEIWLENQEKDYDIIRINGNHIHNEEQYNFDIFKVKAVLKQIKKKTFRLSLNVISILLDVDDSVELHDEKNIKYYLVDDIKDIQDGRSKLVKLFPNLKEDNIDSKDAMDFYINVTNDINDSTEKMSMTFAKIFGKKTLWVTYSLIIINCIIYFLQVCGILNSGMFAMNYALVRSGQWWRIITSAFFHGSIIHLVCNMYSLYAIGSQIETLYGKKKYIFIYFISIIVSSLLSGVLNTSNTFSIGASGAIFGLLGAFLYFGLHYRIYMGNVLVTQILPVILINLFIGFTMPAIDNWAHLGGLAGGYLSSMIVGIEGKEDKQDRINGIIVTILLIIFLCYMLFVK